MSATELNIHIPMFQVDAFTSHIYGGNPAAVCIVNESIDKQLMQRIAHENNLSETAFISKKDNSYSIRWFTPMIEIDLCGHATLAAAHVVNTETMHQPNHVIFKSRKHGDLRVNISNQHYTLHFPINRPKKVELPILLQNMLGKEIIDLYRSSDDYIAVFKDELSIHHFVPDYDAISEIEANGLVITARGKDVDFVSRYFGPRIGIDEDPVTGAIHTALTPLWANLLNKTKFKVKQLSARVGHLECELCDDHVKISGNAVTFSSGKIML